jgi:aerobic carbon-monoxide dehydrogenase medium subunit
MIPQEFEYSAPATLKEALGLLKSGEAKILAGGMSLVPLMKLRLATPEHVVDLGRIPGLNEIREEGGSIKIGAMATHYQIESSPVLRGRSPLLAEAASNIGDVQVRNMGTIGGSIAHADPAADYPASLFALEAKVHIAGASSDRTVSVDDFFQDTFTTAVQPGEIVVDIIVPVETAGTGSSYQKMVQPASGFAIVGIAARIRKQGGKIPMARIGVTGLAPKAYRAANVEKLLEGTAGSDADISKAVAVISDGVDANSDLHASAEYRRHCGKVYAGRAIRAALSRTA